VDAISHQVSCQRAQSLVVKFITLNAYYYNKSFTLDALGYVMVAMSGISEQRHSAIY